MRWLQRYEIEELSLMGYFQPHLLHESPRKGSLCRKIRANILSEDTSLKVSPSNLNQDTVALDQRSGPQAPRSKLDSSKLI